MTLTKNHGKIRSVSPSAVPFVFLSRRFLGIVSLVFSEFWYGARNPYEVVHDRAGFSGKIFCPNVWENGPKAWFFEFIERLGR